MRRLVARLRLAFCAFAIFVSSSSLCRAHRQRREVACKLSCWRRRCFWFWFFVRYAVFWRPENSKYFRFRCDASAERRVRCVLHFSRRQLGMPIRRFWKSRKIAKIVEILKFSAGKYGKFRVKYVRIRNVNFEFGEWNCWFRSDLRFLWIILNECAEILKGFAWAKKLKIILKIFLVTIFLRQVIYSWNIDINRWIWKEMQ